MSNLTVSGEPVFHKEIEAFEKSTPGHYTKWNGTNQDLLENDCYLNENKADGKGISFTISEAGRLQVTYDDGTEEGGDA